MKPKYATLVLLFCGMFMAWLGIVNLSERPGVKLPAAQIVVGLGMMISSLRLSLGKDEDKKPLSK
jgi:hypothetical protein